MEALGSQLTPNLTLQLLTDEPFTRKDVIMLQDPLNLDKKDGAPLFSSFLSPTSPFHLPFLGGLHTDARKTPNQLFSV
jgi:hypothetical protein